MEIVESIPSGDNISRHLYYPFMYKNNDFLWNKIFTFSERNKFCDSVVWRKYIPSIQEVHALGCEKVKIDKLQHPNREYSGAFTGAVNDIRNIKTDNNIQLDVEHDQSNGQGIHHAHLKLLLPEDMNKPSRNDRVEIFSKLPLIFEPLEEYINS